MAGLRPRRDGRRAARPHVPSYGGGPGGRGSGGRRGRDRGLAGLDGATVGPGALLTDPPAPDADAAALLDRIGEGLPGTTPTDGAWEWLGVVAPHTATPLDLLQTTGSALLVIGVALLALSGAGRWDAGRWRCSSAPAR